MSYCCGYNPYGGYYPYDQYYSPYPYQGYPYQGVTTYGYPMQWYGSSYYGLPLGYVYTYPSAPAPVMYGAAPQYPRGEHRVGNCLMICQ